jgi:DNA-binding Xre family transcriptional regulator
MTVTDQLREAMAASGIPQAELARLSQVPEAVLSRFRTKETTLRGDNLDRLCTALGMELVKKGPTKKKIRRH